MFIAIMQQQSAILTSNWWPSYKKQIVNATSCLQSVYKIKKVKTEQTLCFNLTMCFVKRFFDFLFAIYESVNFY